MPPVSTPLPELPAPCGLCQPLRKGSRLGSVFSPRARSQFVVGALARADERLAAPVSTRPLLQILHAFHDFLADRFGVLRELFQSTILAESVIGLYKTECTNVPS